MASLPATNISVNNSTVQTVIKTKNAGESLIDLTIDPNSPKGEIGLAYFDTTLNKPSANTEVDDKVIDKDETKYATKAGSDIASDVDTWKVPLFDGFDSETERDIPTLYTNSLNECSSLITSAAENFMYGIQEEIQLWPDF